MFVRVFSPTRKKRETSMKRLIVAAASVGALSLGLVSFAAGAANAAPAAKPHVSPRATPTITVSPHANLIAGAKVTIVGTGFPASALVVYAECNGDGALGGDTKGCDISTAGKTTTNAKGGFTATGFKIVVGKVGTSTPSNCAQNTTQASKAVECLIGAATTTGSVFALQPITFAAPALTFSYVKGAMVGGVQTYNTTIKESGDYVAQKSGLNNGGYFVIGETSTGSKSCQGTTNGKTWSPPGLPACTKELGEVVQVNWNGRKVALVRVGVRTPGTFSWLIKNATPGKHSVEALGLTSGEKLTGTATVP